MYTYTQKDFKNEAQTKPQGWKEEMLANSVEVDGFIHIPAQIREDLNIKYRLPSLLQKIKNLAASAAEAAATGLAVRGGEDTERVLSICAVCPKLVVDTMACGVCGCNMKYKTQFLEFKCPLGKW